MHKLSNTSATEVSNISLKSLGLTGVTNPSYSIATPVQYCEHPFSKLSNFP